MGIRWVVLTLAAMTFAPPALAQTDLSQVPDDLRPWAAWVLHDVPDVVCPETDGARVCAWPGELRLSATSGGATFSMAVHVDRELDLELPGSREVWPQEVTVDGAPAVVRSPGERPHVRLSPGTHRIDGMFRWREYPEVLTTPKTIARVALEVDGEPVASPRLDGERLWLREAGGDSGAEEDSVRGWVFRKIHDGIPMRVTTRLRLNVSGRARELPLGRVLLAESRPTAVRAQLPVQVTADGDVTTYVRPGTHEIEVDAVLADDVAQLTPPAVDPLFEPQEVWVWVPDETMRSVELSGLVSIDPERTSLPEDWRGGTTFLAGDDAKLDLRVLRRGIDEEPPNGLVIDREIWLDVDGDGYTVRDRISGTMNRGWRLNYAPGADGVALGRVSQAGEDLLITRDPDGDMTGVEIRDAVLDLTADLRLERTERFRAVGWDENAQSLHATLHLPPGWSIVHGEGVDAFKGTWIQSWTLWDFLFVLVVALTVGRLFGWRWMFVALAALVLSHGESGAPRWLWIQLIISLALLRALPVSVWRKGIVIYRGAVLVALVVVLAPFVHSQILRALYPQVGQISYVPQKSAPYFASKEEFVRQAPIAELEAGVEDAAEGYAQELRNLSLAGSAPEKKKKKELDVQRVDPNAVVQTGPGVPTWSWSTWTMSWNGPVRSDHTLKLWLLDPITNRVLGFLRVLLLIALGLLLLSPRDMSWRREDDAPRWWRTLFGHGAAALFLAFAATTMSTRVAHADEPPPAPIEENISSRFVEALAPPAQPQTDVLDELRRRLVAQTTCQRPCVVVSEARLVVDGRDVVLTADVSAGGRTAWTLLGPADALQVGAVEVDGIATSQLRRNPSGHVQVRLEEGAHQVTVRGRLAERESLTLHFEEATRPRRLTVAAPGWAVDGINRHDVPDNSIQLTRTHVTTEASGDLAATPELPPWYQVERLVVLGLPWQVHTTVTREAADRPALVKIPIIDGAKVISDDVRVEEGRVLVDLPRGETTKTFVSELPIRDTFALTAPEGEPWTEVWRVECSRIWRCAFSGLAPTSSTTAGSWQPRWHPWPGEKLDVTVQRPEGAPGQPKTVDQVHYTVRPGKRLMEAKLTLSIRASQGGWQEVTLPPGAELRLVTIDGAPRSIRATDGVVKLPVQPGHNALVIGWQQPWTRTTVERIPPVDVGSEVANVDISFELGEDRLILGTRNDGIRWAPAVLFWPHLAMLLILAFILGTLRRVPLGWPEWLALAVGMSQLPVAAMLPVVGWFVLLSWRERNAPADWFRFNLVQIAAIFLTVAAGVALYAAVHTNLLVDIDMQVDGAGSSNHVLRWYEERVTGALPVPAAVTVPLLGYRVVMLLWSLWLGWKLVSWSRWGWQRFSNGGRWRSPRNPSTSSAPPTDGDVQDDPEAPNPAPAPEPVPRNARDGELIRKEYRLGERGTGASPPQPDAAEPDEATERDGDEDKDDSTPSETPSTDAPEDEEE